MSQRDEDETLRKIVKPQSGRGDSGRSVEGQAIERTRGSFGLMLNVKPIMGNPQALGFPPFRQLRVRWTRVREPREIKKPQ
jgi:hypothetical protein